jgi:tripartite-type tricarboxylate transporter receptor subunit TctC
MSIARSSRAVRTFRQIGGGYAVRRRDVLGLASGAAAASLLPREARAQAGWPSANVTIVVPFTAGGLTDILARSIGEKISPALGRPVIVDNRPGAGGSIGATFVARSAPDGHTLLLGHIGILAVNPSLYASLQYDPLAMTYIAPLAIVPNVLAVNPSVPVHSIKELIDYAKANPGKLNFSSAGTGGAAHIAMAAFTVAAGINMTHVPYRGTPQSVGDVISGQVQMTFTSGVSLLPHVRTGKLRALGVSTKDRLTIAPDIPAIAETLPGFDLSAWYGIVGPGGIPEPVVRRLHGDIRKAMAAPDIGKRLNTEGARHWDVSPEEFRNYVVQETARWKSVIEAAKIKIQ